MSEGPGLAPFFWQEEYQPVRYGDGISRPRVGSRTRQYRVLVFTAKGPPMTWITQAESKRHAIRYAQARWPGCEVELV